ncbi:MAG: amphi-Trp domain-containing protein [Desulfovibrionaceae bacterium]|jgi:amphi-Trp domain-containing protein|nr:amphi-Trp domain-containing protein [Desulfovibrionaceae bacterium]
MGKRKIELDGATELKQVAAYLESIVKGLKAGTLHVQLGADTLDLQLPSVVDFEMSVSQKKEKEKITVELSWRSDAVTTGPGGVVITPAGPSLEIS